MFYGKMKQNAERLPVGIVVERRRSDHPWIDHTWRAVAVIPGAGELNPRGEWKELETGEDFVRSTPERSISSCSARRPRPTALT